MKTRYTLLDHTADVYIHTTGATLDEVFANAAYALFDTMGDASTVSAVNEYPLTTKAANLESALVNFLNELLFIWEIENVILARFSISVSEKEDGVTITATAGGEPFDRVRHRYKTQVKSVTYHGISIQVDENAPADERYAVNVLFDV